MIKLTCSLTKVDEKGSKTSCIGPSYAECTADTKTVGQLFDNGQSQERAKSRLCVTCRKVEAPVLLGGGKVRKAELQGARLMFDLLGNKWTRAEHQ